MLTKNKVMEKQNLALSDVDIVNRFFSALGKLKEDGCIGGLKTLTTRYGFNRWNATTLRDDPQGHYSSFRSSWLQFLVRDYHVNPYWLLLGSGDFYAAGFTAEIVKNLNINCMKNRAACK